MYPVKKQYFQYLPLALSLVLFVILRHFYFWQIGDDSYIYFRYVERALNGKWWSWTDQNAPVEGYSSPLWYLLLIVCGKLGFSVELSARVLGALFAFFTLIATWILSRELKASAFFAGLACLLLTLTHGFNFWATAGLETSLYSALYILSCIGIIREKWWLIPTALIGVARPEGLILLPALLIAIYIVKRKQIPVRMIFLCVVPLIIWMCTRFTIYGLPLPNTFYAKATGDSFAQIFKGSIYALPVLLPLLMSWVIFFLHKNNNILISLGMVTMLLGLIILGGADWMYYFRLLVPLYGIILAILASQLTSAKIHTHYLSVIVLMPMLYFMIPVKELVSALNWHTLDVRSYQEGTMTHASIDLAKQIKQRFPDAKLIAVNHAGALPWALPHYNFIDMVGLNDAHIARARGRLHKKYDAQYVIQQLPDLIILNTRIKPNTDGIFYHGGYWVGEDALVSAPEFNSYYRPTDLMISWEWKVPFPYSTFVKTGDVSWILVYEKRPINNIH